MDAEFRPSASHRGKLISAVDESESKRVNTLRKYAVFMSRLIIPSVS